MFLGVVSLTLFICREREWFRFEISRRVARACAWGMIGVEVAEGKCFGFQSCFVGREVVYW